MLFIAINNAFTFFIISNNKTNNYSFIVLLINIVLLILIKPKKLLPFIILIFLISLSVRLPILSIFLNANIDKFSVLIFTFFSSAPILTYSLSILTQIFILHIIGIQNKVNYSLDCLNNIGSNQIYFSLSLSLIMSLSLM